MAYRLGDTGGLRAEQKDLNQQWRTAWTQHKEWNFEICQNVMQNNCGTQFGNDQHDPNKEAIVRRKQN